MSPSHEQNIVLTCWISAKIRPDRNIWKRQHKDHIKLQIIPLYWRRMVIIIQAKVQSSNFLLHFWSILSTVWSRQIKSMYYNDKVDFMSKFEQFIRGQYQTGEDFRWMGRTGKNGVAILQHLLQTKVQLMSGHALGTWETCSACFGSLTISPNRFKRNRFRIRADLGKLSS